MLGSEFIEFFNKLPVLMPHFNGVYSIDRIPHRMKPRTFSIINLDPKNKPGSHWFVMVKPELGKLEIFDSLGAGSKIGLIKENLKFRTNQSIIYNETPFQMADSHSCGLFAIYFAVERMFNLDLPFIALLEDIFDFENKLENNENIVKQFCEMIIE
jgi:hypothetical protein